MFQAVTVYTVTLTGEVQVKASTDEEAKKLAINYFAQAPLNYVSIKEVKEVQVETPGQ